MCRTVLSIALASAICTLSCVTHESNSVAQWDYADDDSGVYFNLPPGWMFGPAEEFVRRLSHGMPSKAHFYAVRKATIQFNYQDAVLVFSGPPPAEGEPKLSLRDACVRLSRGAPLVGESGSTRAGIFSGNQDSCAIEPNPEHGLEGELYLLMGREGILFVMTFAPTLPAKSQIQDALNRLTVLQ